MDIIVRMLVAYSKCLANSMHLIDNDNDNDDDGDVFSNFSMVGEKELRRYKRENCD